MLLHLFYGTKCSALLERLIITSEQAPTEVAVTESGEDEWTALYNAAGCIPFALNDSKNLGLYS